MCRFCTAWSVAPLTSVLSEARLCLENTEKIFGVHWPGRGESWGGVAGSGRPTTKLPPRGAAQAGATRVVAPQGKLPSCSPVA